MTIKKEPTAIRDMRCWDCGRVLSEQNRTNQDNVKGHPICNDCSRDRWEDLMRDEHPNESS